MVNVDLYISEYVIYKVGQCVGSLGSHHSNAADNRAVHCSFNESKDVFNQTSCLGFSAVVLLLLIGQGIVAMPFLTDDRIHPTLSYDIIL